MSDWTVGRLVEATQGELVTGDRSHPVGGLSIDSRRLRPHDAFFAIRGPRFDGHAFVQDVAARGASCLIVSRLPDPIPPVPVIVVPETTRALGDAAAFHRRQFRIPVIAVTGSCGKTTTKELIAHLLSQDYEVLKTQGTQNNHIGLPLTLLGLSGSHDVAVVELGSNHSGEIAYLARIASPTIAVITNVGPAHLEGFGSLDEVRREKVSLLDALDPKGTAIVPGDQLEVLLQAKSRLGPQARLLTFGSSSQCGIQAEDIRREDNGLSVRLRGREGRFFIPVPGSHNVENTLAALTCVNALGISLEAVRNRLTSFSTLPMRSQLMRGPGVTVLNDCYNANPLSFARALETLKDLDVRRTVVVAGDMLELGACSHAAHEAIGRLAARLGIDVVVAVGSFAAAVAKGASESGRTTVVTCGTLEEVQQRLPSMLQDGDGVLIKGSRKLQLERITEWLLGRPNDCLA